LKVKRTETYLTFDFLYIYEIYVYVLWLEC